MQRHAHISLCDEKWNFYYDYVDFDVMASVPKFLDLIFNMYRLKPETRNQVESGMYSRIDEKGATPIYFKSEDLIYIWVQCGDCKLFGLN
jgi:hypothetical protein